MIVLKFGGASVCDAPGVDRVVALVAGRRAEPLVLVVSAMARTTRALLELARLAAAGDAQAATTAMADLRDFHERESAAYLPAGDLAEVFERLESLAARLRASSEPGRLPPPSIDAVLGQGEELSSRIVTAALRRAGVDAERADSRSLIVTNDQFTRAEPDFEATRGRLREAVQPRLRAGRVVVMAGYVGSTPRGEATTLGKEGSDLTAALVGAALEADAVEVWKDVPGLLTADPRLVPRARVLPEVTHAEAFEMARAGAKVLHPASLLPVARAGVALRVRCTLQPEAPGTDVVRETPQRPPGATAIACRRDDVVPAQGGPFPSGWAEPSADGEAVITVVGHRLEGSPELQAVLRASSEVGGRRLEHGEAPGPAGAASRVRLHVDRARVGEAVLALHDRLFPSLE